MNAVARMKKTIHRRPWLILVAVVVVALGGIVAYAQFVPQSAPTDAAASDDSSTEATELDFVRRDAADPMAIGDVDAPVVLTYWTDLRCPFCAVFSRDTLPILIEEYVDLGEVRIEFHDVAYFGEESATAAVAARAAGEQELFFEYLEAVYAVAPESGHPDLPREELVAFAAEIGVPDMAQFEADLDDPALRKAADESTADAQQLGVSAVPFFVAGDTALSGAQPVDTFRAFLDDALTKAK